MSAREQLAELDQKWTWYENSGRPRSALPPEIRARVDLFLSSQVEQYADDAYRELRAELVARAIAEARATLAELDGKDET
jgi:hypothetical protein